MGTSSILLAIQPVESRSFTPQLTFPQLHPHHASLARLDRLGKIPGPHNRRTLMHQAIHAQ